MGRFKPEKNDLFHSSEGTWFGNKCVNLIIEILSKKLWLQKCGTELRNYTYMVY